MSFIEDSLRDALRDSHNREAMLRNRVQELEALINTPETKDFLRAVELEAAHQVERWGADDRLKKDDRDWLWLIAYLAGKVLFGKSDQEYGARIIAQAVSIPVRSLAEMGYERAPVGDEKYQHRIITIAAAALNWHRNRWPGKAPETELGEEG